MHRNPGTEVEIESRTDEIRSLKACINDLVSVLALPAIWSGHEEPSHIGNTLLDILLGLLHLDFAYLRLGGSFGDSAPMEMIHVGKRRNLTAQPEKVGRALNNWLTAEPSNSPFLVPNPVGEGKISIALRRLGLQDQIGVMVAGSTRMDFPTKMERVVLDVAVNQAAVGLHEAWRLIEQRQIAQELDHRVAQRTRELVERDARIRRLVDANIIGVLISELEGQILESNDAFLKMVGYSREDLVSGRIRWTDLTPTEWQPLTEQAVARIKATGTCEAFEKEYIRKDGSRVPVLIGAAGFEGNSSVAFVIDLTERKRAEEALQRSEFYLAEGQRLGHTGSWAFGPAGFDYWSAELFRMYGLAPASLAPTFQEYLDCIHPQDREFMASQIKRMLADASGCDVIKRILRPNGELRYIRCVGTPVLENGTLLRIVGTAMDVTEHELLTQELRRREAYLGEAQRLSHTGSWAWSPVSGDIGYWSEECYRVLGFDPAGSPPRFETFLQRIHPDDQAASRERFEKAVRDQAEFQMDYRIVHPDGETRNIHVVGHPTLGPSGDLREFVGTVIDVTERLRAEDDLRQAFDEIKKLKDQLYNENLALRDEVDRASMFEEIVGTSKPLKAVLSRIAKVAPTDSTVLITGETGTGKELIARAVHKRSQRSGRAFVSVNCAAIPRDLIPSELFGHEKGAFTGAMQRRLGRFEQADGGTIFLDEVGELLPDTQVALLRVLQEREFERVGGGHPIHVDVRVIAATNRDLKTAVANGTFREDLFYRLNVFPIEVPPLRERKDDILMLVEYFVQRYASRAGKQIRSIEKKTLDLLQSYGWPGNIRELQNVIERSVILSSGDFFSVDEMWLSKETPPPASRVKASAPFKVEVEPRSEREIVEAALAATRGRVSGPSGAATKLGVPPSTLDHRIKALKINKDQFKFR
jgi:PAS domain S-box-containing protein